MIYAQYLLTKLGEEAAEVIQRAAKQIQFGAAEVQDGQSLSNARRLRNEINDFLTVVEMLEAAHQVPTQSAADLDVWVEAKKAKMLRFLRLSEALGCVVPETATQSKGSDING